MRLRPAEAADVPRIAELVRAAYAHYAERMSGPPRPVLDDYAEVVRRSAVTVAESEGAVIGVVVLVRDDEGLWLDNVAVDPAVGRTGVGRALLEHAEAEARRAGFDAIRLLTHETMTENQALYRRIGYAEYQRRTTGDGSSLVYMRKPLDDSPR